MSPKLCPPVRGRSEGSRRLLSLGKSQEEIAAEIRVEQSTVSRWCAGDKRPGPNARARIAKAFGIPGDAWDRPPRPPVPPKDEKAADVDVSVRQRARDLARDLDRLREAAWNDPDATTLERAKILNSAAVGLKLLGTMTGELLEVNEARVLKLPGFRRIDEAITRALTPWPDAMRAVGEALKRLGEGGDR
jgi:transcriptional regulator with XRE-family HTH domain